MATPLVEQTFCSIFVVVHQHAGFIGQKSSISDGVAGNMQMNFIPKL